MIRTSLEHDWRLYEYLMSLVDTRVNMADSESAASLPDVQEKAGLTCVKRG